MTTDSSSLGERVSIARNNHASCFHLSKECRDPLNDSPTREVLPHNLIPCSVCLSLCFPLQEIWYLFSGNLKVFQYISKNKCLGFLHARDPETVYLLYLLQIQSPRGKGGLQLSDKSLPFIDYSKQVSDLGLGFKGIMVSPCY